MKIVLVCCPTGVGKTTYSMSLAKELGAVRFSMDTLWKRLKVADTLVYLDMPVWRHSWWVTKRFLQGVWVSPAGWPEGSPLLKGTLNSYTMVRLCNTKLTTKYRDYVEQVKTTKQVYHLRSRQDIA